MTDLQEKIARLPMWVREHIKHLEREAEPNNVEIRRLRQECAAKDINYKRLQGRADAMNELLTCAARGGHEVAKEYVDRIVKEFAYYEEEDNK